METLTWNHLCYFCKRPILRGRPTLVLSTQKPDLVGVSHSTCTTKNCYGYFEMVPPYRLTVEQVSFLVHFYPMFSILPGGIQAKRELRWSLVGLLNSYPSSIKKPMPILKRFIREQRRWGLDWRYKGDLEMDFLRFLGQVLKEAKEQPIEVVVDFRK
jgi:hypothetical protein